MNRSHLLAPFSLTLALAACHGGDSGSDASVLGSGGSSGEIENLGLAAGVLGSGGQRMLVVSEKAQGGRDGNGDGDAADVIVQMLDMESGVVTSTGLAAPPPSVTLDIKPTVTASGSCAVFLVNEAAQQADLNGDGDLWDEWTHVFDVRSGTTQNLGLRHQHALTGEHLVALSHSDPAEGAFRVLVHDLRDGSTAALPYTRAIPLAVVGERVAFVAGEEPGGDWNGDGDELDSVLLFYDATTRSVAFPGWAITTGTAATAAGYVGVQVSESQQGQDLDGDGALDDVVGLVVDPLTGLQRGPAQPGGVFEPSLDESLFLLRVSESALAEDLNGDRDVRDHVLHVHEPIAGSLLSTGCAVREWTPMAAAGTWIGIPVSEEAQGADLDRDGARNHVVLQVFDRETGELQNTGLEVRSLAALHDRFVLLVPEQRSDLNGDRDRDDFVVHEWIPASGEARNLQTAAKAVGGAQAPWVAILLSEPDQRVDFNSDGDREDCVLGAYDGRTRGPRSLGLAVFGTAVPAPDGRLVTVVSEPGQGVDLNGDRDLRDGVAFLIHLR